MSDVQGYGDIYDLDTVVDVSTGETKTLFKARYVRSQKFDKGLKGAACFMCGTVYPMEKLMKKNGRFYCTVKGCADDFSPKVVG